MPDIDTEINRRLADTGWDLLIAGKVSAQRRERAGKTNAWLAAAASILLLLSAGLYYGASGAASYESSVDSVLKEALPGSYSARVISSDIETNLLRYTSAVE